MTPTPQIPEGGVVADAPRGNWVDTLAPAASRPYLRLSRADRPIGTWLLLIPCLWGVALAAASDGGFVWHDLWLVLSATAGAFLMRGAGCTWNDITDRHFDAAVTRTRSRPIPSGQVSVRGAVIWMGAQALLAAAILATYNALSIMLGVGSVLLVLIYPFAKRFTWWPQAFLGLAFNWGAVLLWAGHNDSVPAAAIALYGAGIAWTLFYDTIYAHQDKDDDALIGVKSTARLFGQNTARWLLAFMAATMVLMALAVILALGAQARPLQMIAGLGAAWGIGWHMAWQIRHLNIDDAASCLHLFRSNRDAGFIAALFLAVAALL